MTDHGATPPTDPPVSEPEAPRQPAPGCFVAVLVLVVLALVLKASGVGPTRGMARVVLIGFVLIGIPWLAVVINFITVLRRVHREPGVRAVPEGAFEPDDATGRLQGELERAGFVLESTHRTGMAPNRVCQSWITPDRACVVSIGARGAQATLNALFTEGVGLATSNCPALLGVPAPSWEFRAAFAGASLGELLTRHGEGIRFIESRLGVRQVAFPADLRAYCELETRQEVGWLLRRRRVFLLTFPLWMLTSRLRANRSVEQRRARLSPNDLAAIRASNDAMSG